MQLEPKQPMASGEYPDGVNDPDALAILAAEAFEEERLSHLYNLNVLDTPPQERFDRVTRLVANALNVNVALVSLIDRDRQWFKSTCGLSVTETPRSLAFCAHALHEPEILIVEDARDDPRFSGNPLVTGAPHIRFYAGAVLYSAGKLPLGTLCVIDTKARRFSATEREMLLTFARIIESELQAFGVDQHERVEAQLAANVDPITGFFNFREFEARARALDDSLQVMESRQAGDSQLTRAFVITIEVPRLDNLLRLQGLVESQRVAAGLAKIVQESLEGIKSLFGRYSRNAIIIYLLTARHDADALGRLLSQRLERRVNRNHFLKGIDLRIGVSARCATMEQSLNQCQFAAERLQGRKGIQYSCFSDRDRQAVDRNVVISGALAQALADEQFVLHYQPKVALGSGATVGLEALIRWRHPQLGFISPPELFRAAGDVNLVVELDRWVAKTAIAHLRRLLDCAGVTPVVSINLCCETLHDPATVDFIIATLRACNVPARYLQIEILENSAIADFDHIIGAMDGLRRQGVSFALDDFGTGYSSLGYLKRLPIDTVKLDRSFISQIDRVDADTALARGIILLAHDLKMQVVAEGVETSGQLAVLEAIHCDAVQGYYFSRPVAFDEIKLGLDDPLHFSRRPGGEGQ